MLILGTPSWYHIFTHSNELDRVMYQLIKSKTVESDARKRSYDEQTRYLKYEYTLVPDPKSNFHRVHKEYSERIKLIFLEVAKVYKALYQRVTVVNSVKDKLSSKTEQLLVAKSAMPLEHGR